MRIVEPRSHHFGLVTFLLPELFNAMWTQRSRRAVSISLLLI